jgi:hypothetical protein
MNPLNDTALLILADLGRKPRRLQARLRTLSEVGLEAPSRPILALVASGYATITDTREGGFTIQITDAGLAKHRELMKLLQTL